MFPFNDYDVDTETFSPGSGDSSVYTATYKHLLVLEVTNNETPSVDEQSVYIATSGNVDGKIYLYDDASNRAMSGAAIINSGQQIRCVNNSGSYLTFKTHKFRLPEAIT